MTSFYELVISGSFLYVKGVITGICIGAEKEPYVIFNKEHKIESETMGEMLKELIGLSEVIVHVILPETLVDLIKVKLNHKSANVKIKSSKLISSAEFEFDFEAYTEKHKNEIKEILDKPHGNVILSDDTEINENYYNDSKGVEVYTPAHNYEYTGEGKANGSFPDIFELFKKCDDHPLINVEKLHLIF